MQAGHTESTSEPAWWLKAVRSQRTASVVREDLPQQKTTQQVKNHGEGNGKPPRLIYAKTWHDGTSCKSLLHSRILEIERQNQVTKVRSICVAAYYKEVHLWSAQTWPVLARGSHSFTCHPLTNHTCLYSPAVQHHHPVAGTPDTLLYTTASKNGFMFSYPTGVKIAVKVICHRNLKTGVTRTHGISMP